MTTVFAFPDYLVDVNIIEAPPTFDTSYIQRILFLVVDPVLPTDYEYHQDITSADQVDSLPALTHYVKEYFYKNDVKSCDILVVKNPLGGPTGFEELIKANDPQIIEFINDRTFTCSVDISIPLTTLVFTTFRGVFQSVSVGVFIDANVLNKTTMFYFEDSVIPGTVLQFNQEMARLGSFFVNRQNFFNPVSPKTIDFTASFPVTTTADMNTANANGMTFTAIFNGLSYIADFTTGNKTGLKVYYLEQIRRAVQEACFGFLTTVGNTFYNQENLNIITTVALNAVLVYSVSPFGFVNEKGTKVDNLILENIPKVDRDARIVRLEMSVLIFDNIERIKVNISQTLGA